VQLGNGWNDGTDSVNQCAAMPGGYFTYQFVVDQVILISDYLNYNMIFYVYKHN
jgi:hypothetical protein